MFPDLLPGVFRFVGRGENGYFLSPTVRWLRLMDSHLWPPQEVNGSEPFIFTDEETEVIG